MQESGSEILIDGQGRWWYEGNQIVHPEVLALFKKSLKIDAVTGLFFIDYEGKQAPVTVERTPFFINGIDVEKSHDGKLVQVNLQIDDGTREILEPESLRLDDSGVLQAKVKGGRFEARCVAAAHFRLAELLEENGDGNFFLTIGGKSFLLSES